jgi:hypothetical protein
MRRLLLILVVAVLAATMMMCSSAPALAQNDPDDEDIEIFCGPLSEPEDADGEAYPGEEFACVAITPEEQD